MTSHTVHVAPSSGAYDVVVGPGILDEAGKRLTPLLPSTSAFIISDSNVAPLYLERLQASLAAAGIDAPHAVFPAGEASKNLSTLSDLLEAMAMARLTRSSAVIALGGGVTGDMAGLAAALYMRGIAYVQVPTSLLAMVDSSVGGKCAVDLAAGKNLAGAFLQPLAVLADTSTLQTLDGSVFSDGCAEIVKHAVLADPELFGQLETEPLAREGEPGLLTSVIARNVDIKRRFVEADEREHGRRKLLNLGHSIGHAIEAASGYTLGHGHAVAIGLCAIARASEKVGWAEQGIADRIEAVAAAHGLPTESPYPADDLIGYARLDKKSEAGGITLAIPERIGSASLRFAGFDEFSELIRLGVA